MAVITGKVQLFEDNESKTREVGQPFARKENGRWVDLDGKNVSHKEITSQDLAAKIKKKKPTK